MTTVVITHDMNSVMEIGEKIVFLKNGIKEWEGSSETIFKTDNEAVTDFVYSSELFKKVRKMYIRQPSPPFIVCHQLTVPTSWPRNEPWAKHGNTLRPLTTAVSQMSKASVIQRNFKFSI